MKMNVAVMASGRGTNFQAILERSRQEDASFKIRLLITDNAGALAIRIAEEAGIPWQYRHPSQFETKAAFEDNMAEIIRASGCELVCLAGYMRILGKTFLSTLAKDVINIHPSLLPAFPGLDAQKQALEYGVKYSGCTVHFVDEGMDTGPIIDQRTVPVYHSDDEDSLSERILVEEHLLYPHVVQLFGEKKITRNGRMVVIDR